MDTSPLYEGTTLHSPTTSSTFPLGGGLAGIKVEVNLTVKRIWSQFDLSTLHLLSILPISSTDCWLSFLRISQRDNSLGYFLQVSLIFRIRGSQPPTSLNLRCSSSRVLRPEAPHYLHRVCRPLRVCTVSVPINPFVLYETRGCWTWLCVAFFGIGWRVILCLQLPSCFYIQS